MEVFNIILIIGVAQGFVFNGINFYNYKFKNKTIIFLNLFVLFLTLNNLQAWLIEKNIRFSFYYLKHLLVPWYIIITPMFFLFLSKYLQLKKRLKVLIYTTITIFLTSIITRLLILYFLNDIQNESKFLLSLKLYNNVEEVFGFVFTFSLFIYCIFIFLKTFNSANKILEYDNLNWLKMFFWLGLVIMLFWLIAIIINTVFSFSNPTIIYSPLRISTSILIYWLGYQGMYQQKFVDHRISLRKKLSQQTSFPKKSNEIIQKKDVNKQEKLFLKIHAFITEEKKFIDPLLSLEHVAGYFNISTSQLSPIINKYANKTFTDYINEFRVEQAKKLLIHSNYINYAVLSIGLESGFNSKSAFYNAFKKHTGLTPTAYKNQVLKK